MNQIIIQAIITLIMVVIQLIKNEPEDNTLNENEEIKTDNEENTIIEKESNNSKNNNPVLIVSAVALISAGSITIITMIKKRK